MCVGVGVCTNQQTLLRKFDHQKKREIEIEIVFKGIWPDQQSALGDKGGGKGGVCGGGETVDCTPPPPPPPPLV